MKSRRFVYGAVAGAGLAAAVFTSAAAAAYIGERGDELPPGSVPAGAATGVTNTQDPPFYDYQQATYPYNVLDHGNVVGTLDDTQTSWDSGTTHSLQDVVSNGTGTAAAWDGSEYDSYSVLAPGPLGGITTLFGYDYLKTPDGSSDYMTFFNNQFPIFDTFPAASASTAGADLVDPNWLTDLLGSLGLGSLL
ncbi:MAG TPA: hypothetical protein VFR17_14605 [Mycobacterium sp.]|nr:hypothetical protein [Mycobacterium sp.]